MDKNRMKLLAGINASPMLPVEVDLATEEESVEDVFDTALLEDRLREVRESLRQTEQRQKEARGKRDHFLAAVAARPTEHDYNFKVGSAIQRALVLGGPDRLLKEAQAEQTLIVHLTAVAAELRRLQALILAQLQKLREESDDDRAAARLAELRRAHQKVVVAERRRLEVQLLRDPNADEQVRAYQRLSDMDGGDEGDPTSLLKPVLTGMQVVTNTWPAAVQQVVHAILKDGEE